MEYQIVILPSAERDLTALAPETREAILRRLEWLRRNAGAVIHRRLHNLPADLSGLCKLRVADYRVLYWHDAARHVLTVYRVQHRSEAYRRLR